MSGRSVKIGDATPRWDARQKVAGAAIYGMDEPVPHALYAFLVTSAIARGHIVSIDDRDSRAVLGVVDILTYRNVGERIKSGKIVLDHGYMGTSIAPLSSNKIWHDGQIVAMVVAETFESAREAAHRLRVDYQQETPTAGFDRDGAEVVAVADVSKAHHDPKVGDAESAYNGADEKLEAIYSTPTQHHNPIELFTTICAWNGDRLTVWESSQNVWGFKNGLSEQLGIPVENIRVVSPFVGGAFGSRGSLTQRTAIVALAAKRLGRPVKLEATRTQGFTIATYRAETRHQIKLGATADGKLVSLSHYGWEVTSRPDNYNVSGTDASTRLYACPNIDSKVFMVRADRNTPGFMRSPPETPYLFAIESAMDELAYKLKLDPIELRRRNDTQYEPIKGLPFTSRSLMPCFDKAAEAFGWSARKPEPGSMRDGDWQIGWGCAATTYPTLIAPACARVRLTPDGSVILQTATHEIGNGVYTVIAMMVSDCLGVPTENINVMVGDSDLPPAPVTGGSNSTASICNVVAKACEEIKQRIIDAAQNDDKSPLKGVDESLIVFANGRVGGKDDVSENLTDAMKRASGGAIESYVENAPYASQRAGVRKLFDGHSELKGGASLDDRVQFAFGAQFVEVRVHARTCEVRAPRVVGAYAAGTIVNKTTAESQLMGGLIFGLSSALHEATEIDDRSARYYNTDLAEYLIPVNADVGDVKVILVPENDTQVNPLGIKGIGELGNVGVNAALANGVFHATGKRIRDLPIRIEKLLS